MYKVEAREMKLGLLEVLRGESGRLPCWFKFIGIGTSAFVVDACLYLSLYHCLELSLLQARAIAFTCALSITWGGNRYFTFKHRHQMPKGQQILLTSSVALLAAVVNWSVFLWVSALFSVHPLVSLVALGCGVLAGLVVNWLGANFISFKEISIKR